jgi:MFS family permease
MTVLCGTAGSFELLFVYRMGVGVGEAGGSPPAHSMISDYLPPERRATGLAVFALGVPIGLLIGYLVGGWLDEVVGWRLAFLAAGVPGLVVSLVVAWTLREPPRGHSDGLDASGDAAPTIAEVMRFLWGARSFRHVAVGAALNGFTAYSIVTWAPAFLIRSHGMGTAEAGAWLALGATASPRSATRSPRFPWCSRGPGSTSFSPGGRLKPISCARGVRRPGPRESVAPQSSTVEG